MEMILSNTKVLNIYRLLTEEAVEEVDNGDDLKIYLRGANAMCNKVLEVIDECGKLATDYEREINRAGDDEIMSRWQNENGVTITKNEDMDIDSFKNAVDGIDEWYQKELENQGYDDAKELIAAFQ